MCTYFGLLSFIFIISSPLLIHSYMVYEEIIKEFAKNKQNPKISVNLQNAVGAFSEANVGAPLFLTPFIEKGEYEEAQTQATVPPMLAGIESFSGFITVNKNCNSNLFFWMFKAMNGDWKTKPLITWLQGGPGATSMFGNIREIGPMLVDEKGQLQKRQYAWNRDYNILFIDNPVGAGFSFTDSESCYATSGDDVTRDLYEFFRQFYKIFFTLKKNKLYLTGESYAGKYIPSLAHHISLKNKERGFVIPLAGIAMVSPYMDPINMMVYGDYVYQLGIVDRRVRDTLHKHEDKIRALIKDSNRNNFEAWVTLSRDIFETIRNVTGLKTVYNYIHDDVSLGGLEFINKPKTRKAIHVGNLTFTDLSEEVYYFLVNDTMNSVAPLIEDLLNWGEINVVTVTGQLDVITAYPLSENVFSHLKWKDAVEYKQANRCQYRIDQNVVGYHKSAGSFTEIMLRNCGHILPADCPATAFDLINKFIKNITALTC